MNLLNFFAHGDKATEGRHMEEAGHMMSNGSLSVAWIVLIIILAAALIALFWFVASTTNQAQAAKKPKKARKTKPKSKQK